MWCPSCNDHYDDVVTEEQGVEFTYEPVTAFIARHIDRVPFVRAVNKRVAAEMFPAVVCTLGVGLPFAISQSIFAGTAEYIALSSKTLGHESGFFWYVSGCIGISLITFLYVSETRWSSQMTMVDTPAKH